MFRTNLLEVARWYIRLEQDVRRGTPKMRGTRGLDNTGASLNLTDIQKALGSVCESCQRSNLKIEERKCLFCQEDHCHHYCSKRQAIIASGAICHQCRESLNCSFCYDSKEHCPHSCPERMDKLRSWDLCEKCENELDGCVFCEEKNHCWHNCKTMKFKLEKPFLKVIFMLVGLGLFIFEVGSDIYLAYGYFTTGNPIFGVLTTICVALSGVSMSIYSIYMWRPRLRCFGPWDCLTTVMNLLSALLLITPVAWTVTNLISLRKVLKAKKEDRLGGQTVTQYAIKAKILYRAQLFEAFLEDSPQLVLQLYILTRDGFEDSNLLIQQLFSIGTSWLSIGWIMVAFYESVHPDIFYGIAAKITMFLWHFFTVGPRVLAFALFASAYHEYVFAVAAGHTMLMFAYRFSRSRSEMGYGESSLRLAAADLLVALTYNFVFNPKMAFFGIEENKTKSCNHYFYYYFLVYLENGGLMAAWYMKAYDGTLPPWYGLCAIGFVMGAFWVGLMCMCLFYGVCHKEKNYDD